MTDPRGLWAPRSFPGFESCVEQGLANGCGSKGKGYLVPDHIFRVDFREACIIHDYMYYEADATLKDKDDADRAFLHNMMCLIDAAHPRFQFFYKIVAIIYFLAVQYAGGPAFWMGKDDEKEVVSE